MASLHWLASYPKSGNTWLRILLANYLTDGTADINALARYGMSGAFSRMVFDQYCGFKSSVLPRDIVESLRPEVYRALAAHAGMPLVLKVHDKWHLTAQGEPLLPADTTSGVVYVVRNVLDVAVSAASHWSVNLETAVERLCDTGFAISAGEDRLDTGLPQRLGSWSDHACSWTDDSGLPVHLIRYEDMIADTLSGLLRLLAFLGWPVDAERAERAVAQSSFERLQKLERATGFRERPADARSHFFRQGRSGGWRNELPAPLVARLIDAHGDTMRRFGYLDDRGEPVERGG